MTSDTLDPRRHLDIEGAYNIRDLGGYPSAEGGRTRWGVLLRADGLQGLPVRSQAALIDYGIRTVIDLRTSREIQQKPGVFFGSSEVAYWHQNMTGDVLPYHKSVTGTVYDRILEVYTGILDLRQSVIREALATLAAPGALPALFHCNGGKDRTGILAALLLGIAGVPEETIEEDYALSARFILALHLADNPDLDGSGYTWQQYQEESCPPEAMTGTLRHLREKYGGIESYVRATGLRDDQIESLREAMLG